MSRLPLLLIPVTAALLSGCHNAPPPGTAADTPAKILIYSQYSQGDALDLVQTQLGLDTCEVRYRTGMPDGQMGMIYFLPNGNLHIDAGKIGSTWTLLSSPLLEPSSEPAQDRVAEWDRASDQQKILSRSDR